MDFIAIQVVKGARPSARLASRRKKRSRFLRITPRFLDHRTEWMTVLFMEIGTLEENQTVSGRWDGDLEAQC